MTPTNPEPPRASGSSTLRGRRVFVAGHRGMVGSALVRRLRARGDCALLLRDRTQLDLRDAAAVDRFFAAERPEIVLMAAARVGGIEANRTFPVEFLEDNLAIALNVIRSAFRHDTARLLFLGSSCIYPREAPQPIPEEALLTGPLEPTNEAYALAKIAGLKLCQYYRRQHGRLFHSVMPTNLYGPGDYYHPERAHVIPALLRRFHEARETGQPRVVLWGTGTPRREFLHVDDLADACLHLLELPDPPDWVNVGCGTDLTIRELAELIREVTGYAGEMVFDPTRPDGTPRKLLDVSKLRATGWAPRISLPEGLAETCRDFLAARAAGTLRE